MHTRSSLAWLPVASVVMGLALVGALGCPKEPAVIHPADVDPPKTGGQAVTPLSKATCLAEGRARERGIKRDIDLATAYPVYEQCCDLGVGEACVRAGEMRLRGIPRSDATVAAALFEKGCTLDDAESCVQRAQSVRMGLGVKKDEAAADALEQKACDLGHPAGCARRALALPQAKEADGITLLDRALALGRRLCEEEKAPLHCGATAKLAAKRSPNLSDKMARKAFDLRREACTRGDDATACYELGMHYERGEPYPRSLRAASDLYAGACKRGHADACRRERRMKTAQEQVTPVAKQATACRVSHGKDPACRELVNLCTGGNKVACTAAVQVNLTFCTEQERLGCLPVEVLCSKQPGEDTCGSLLKLYGDRCVEGSGQFCTSLKAFCAKQPEVPGCAEQLARVGN